MRKIIYLLLLPAIVLGGLSCNKALKETPYSFISPANFYKDEADATAAVNGVYATFWGWGLMYQSWWLTGLDDDHADGAAWFLGNIGAGNPQGFWGLNNIWSDHYLMISRANAVLENIGGAVMDEGEKNRMIGEVTFLRGWSYFDLVRIYGQVPIHLKTVASGDKADMPKSPVADVFKVVIDDFTRADSLLYPASDPRSGEAGRVNKGVAEAFLAQAYATMGSGSLSGVTLTVRGGPANTQNTYTKDVVAGYEGFDSKACFDSARAISLRLITTGEYGLFPNFMDAWTIANRNVGENMWEIQALAGNNTFETDLYYYFSASQPSRGSVGAVWITDNHYNDYEHDDDRILKGVAHQYIVDYGSPQYTNYICYPEVDTALYKCGADTCAYIFNAQYYDRAYTMKYSDVSNPGTGNSDNDVPMLRYSQVLLTYAEAENEVNGPTGAAYQYLNMVRTRSHASLAPSGMNQQQFRSFVFEERGREFTLENVRRYDLLRWGVYLQVMNKLGVIEQGTDQLSKVRSSRNLLFPISTDEINANTALGGDNPGW